MDNQNSFVSTITDNNIFHIFAFDIIKRYKSNINNILISDININKTNPCQLWRFFVFKKLFPNVNMSFSNEILTPSNVIRECYDCWKFIEYPIDKNIYEIVNKINSKCHGEYILLNQRSLNNRYLYEYETKLPLGDYLLTKNFKYPVKVCNFEIMTPEEQYEICSKAKIFISAHGGGCTNLIFTPIECPLIEINFRKHWYCDNVCDDHFSGKISINEKCNGKLNYRSYFHKADYHNLCHLIGKKYTEIEAVCYGGKFTDKNPISKEEIYIDGKYLINHIEKYL